MFGIDPRKAGFGANADPGNVCAARNAQFEQGFFDLSFGETMSAHHSEDDVGDFCVADYLVEQNVVHLSDTLHQSRDLP